MDHRNWDFFSIFFSFHPNKTWEASMFSPSSSSAGEISGGRESKNATPPPPPSSSVPSSPRLQGALLVSSWWRLVLFEVKGVVGRATCCWVW
jgi:hypothetical protein